MSFDFSTFSAEARRIAHRSGRGDGDADRAADWVQLIVNMLGGAVSTLNEFPISQYTPGSQALTNGNFVAAFNNAVTACKAGGGGRVTIPAGVWDISEELRVSTEATAYNSTVLFIEGAGQISTCIRYPDNYTGNGLYLNGFDAPATAVWQWGGVRNLTIQGGVTGVGASGKGLTLNACVGVIFENVTIFNWGQVGGTGVYCRDFAGGGFNSQDLLFLNCDIRTCYNNFDVKAFMATFINVKSIQAVNRAFLGDSVILNMFGGNLQTAAPIVFELIGDGGCRVLLEGVYWEGVVTESIFKFNAPAVGFNTIEVKRLISGVAPLCVDAAGPGTNITLDTIIGAFQATTFVKGRNLDTLTVINPGGTYDAFSAKFDLDTTSLGNMHYRDGGYLKQGGAHYIGTTLNLAGFAEGFEPTADNQAMVWNTSTNKPRVRSVGAWADVSTEAEFPTLYDLLSPYAVEIFDTGVSRTLTTSLSAPTALVGLKAGSSLANGVGGQAPGVTASQTFRNQYAATCTYDAASTTAKWFTGTLSTAIASGKHPGVFVVFAPSTTTQAAARRRPVMIKNGSEQLIVAFDDNDTGATTTRGLVVFYKSVVLAIPSLGGVVKPHVFYAASQTDNRMHYQLDGGTANSVPGAGALTSSISTAYVGGNDADNTGGDVIVSFLAILDTPIPDSVVNKAQKLACALYGIG